jgi:GNAT superfamily N-acetyltransferase
LIHASVLKKEIAMSPYTIHTHAERPELLERRVPTTEVWPLFMLQDAVADQYWHCLYDYFAEYQFYLCDEDDIVIGEGNSIPVMWDGQPTSLPDAGWDAIFMQGVQDYEAGIVPNTLSALQAMVLPSRRGQGISRVIIEGMRDIAKKQGFKSLIAPVRPSLKPMYPLTPMEHYVRWTRDDGLLFDPWMRVHERLGAKTVKVAPQSMTIDGTIAEWESWTKMKFPESGRYIVPGALSPVEFDHEKDEGVYIEPNVWMHHTL